MPSGWAHGFYWVTLSTVVPPPVVSKGGGYPVWQASSVGVGSLFGGLQGYWERLLAWAKVWKRLRHWSPERVTAALDRWEKPPAMVVPQPAIVVPQPTIIKVKTEPEPEPAPLPAALAQAERMLNHPAYPFAVEAVKKTATTLGFNRPEAWQGLSRHMKASPGRAENVFRHMEACRITRETCGSTLTNPECNLLVELAYHDWVVSRK